MKINVAVGATEKLKSLVVTALEDMKAVDICELYVAKMTSITDYMIIASGNSDRHVRSIIGRIVEEAKAHGYPPVGVEGQGDGQWGLVDLGDVVVHVMLPRVREFYQLEKLWSIEESSEKASDKVSH